jgi:hypothetical protein
MHLPRRCAIFAFISALTLNIAVFAQSNDQVSPPVRVPMRVPMRVAVIGASASAGMGCVYREKRDDLEFAGSFRLIDMVKLACPELKMVSTDMSSGFFFLSPIANGAKAAKRALEFKPDCVIAMDFLFWYCYGDDAPDGGKITDEAQRLAKFELGLKELDGFTMPIVVGDVPDMSAAIGKMLSQSQVPAPDTLVKLNARFEEWASSRPTVHTLSLSKMQKQLMEQNALEIGGKQLIGTKDAPLLQRDELHPTARGLAGLACVVAAELKTALKCPADQCTPEPEGTMGRAREELKPSGRLTKPAASTPATSPASPAVPVGSR